MTPKEWYAERLRDNRWIRKRDSIKIRDNYTCKKCGDEERKQDVHHIEYLQGKDLWDYPDHLLETLCDKCHTGEHVVIPTLAQLTQTRLELLDKINTPGVSANARNAWRQSVSIMESEAMKHYGVDLNTTLNPTSPTDGREQKIICNVC